MPKTSWVNPAVEVGASPIAGQGLFARRTILTDEPLIKLGGRVVSTGELEHLFEAAERTGSYVDTIHIDRDVHLVIADDSISRFGNHGCDPTMWLDGPFDLVARREIAAGEELTVDYATFTTLTDFYLTCMCNTSTCRGSVTGNDWKLTELQMRYANHWSPSAQALITAM